MKKFSGVFFLVLLSFNFFGIFCVFKIQQILIRWEVKNRIKAGIPSEKLSCFTYANHDIEKIAWSKDGEEFRYHGKMFDVVRLEYVGDSVRYYCMDDSKENNLLDELEIMISKKMDEEGGPGKTTSKLIKDITSLKFICSGKYTFPIPVQLNCTWFISNVESILSPLIEIIIPPPQLI